MLLDTERFKNPLFWYKVIGIVIVFTVIVWGINSLYLNPSFCQRCHVIEPYYESWSTSSHADMLCIDCHFESGVVNFMKQRIRIFNNVITYFIEGKITKKGFKPKNKVCVVCHVIDREVTPAGDVIIPHTVHASMAGIYCVDCHKEFVHRKKTFPSIS